MAIADYLQKLVELKKQLAANLRSMGVAAEDGEKLNTLVPKVLECKTEQNVEFVEGTDFTGTTNNSGFITAGITTAMTKVNIPDSTKQIGNFAFYGCKKLTSITIPNGVTSLGDSSFSGCTSLIDVKIPGSVIEKSYGTFMGCTSLTNVQIEDGFKYLGSSGENLGFFEDCSNLESIIIPSSVISFGRRLFINCKNLAHIYYTGTKTQWNNITKYSGWNNAMGTSVSGGTVIHYNYVP